MRIHVMGDYVRIDCVRKNHGRSHYVLVPYLTPKLCSLNIYFSKKYLIINQ